MACLKDNPCACSHWTISLPSHPVCPLLHSLFLLPPYSDKVSPSHQQNLPTFYHLNPIRSGKGSVVLVQFYHLLLSFAPPPVHHGKEVIQMYLLLWPVYILIHVFTFMFSYFNPIGWPENDELAFWFLTIYLNCKILKEKERSVMISYNTPSRPQIAFRCTLFPIVPLCSQSLLFCFVLVAERVEAAIFLAAQSTGSTMCRNAFFLNHHSDMFWLSSLCSLLSWHPCPCT